MAGTVTVQCVACHHQETHSPIPTEPPMCSKCLSPVYVVRASTGVLQR